jgi:hypothetical protein
MGFDCEVSPAIGAATYETLYLRGNGSRLVAFREAWQQRRADLRRVEDFDAIFVQKGFFPGLYAGLETAMAHKRPLVLDLDDAVWLPREGGSRLLRVLHRERAVQEMLRRAAAVTAGNEFLADYARRFSRHVSLVPSTVEVARYPRAAGITVIGWIGSRTTLSYLKPLAPVFQRLGIMPRVIAAGNPDVVGFPVEFREWRLDTELDELAQLGIGIAPLPDTPWERGKCGVKVLQYMACGLPVVASAVGVHKEIIQPGINGLLAHSEADWLSHLQRLLAEPSRRQQLGAAARETVAKHYDVSVSAERVAKVLAASTHTQGITARR